MWKPVGVAALLMLTTWQSAAQSDWRQQAVPYIGLPTLVRMQDAHWYAPRTVEYIRRVEALQQALDAHCQGGVVIPARTAWREALVAWDRLSAVAVGPLVERRSARRIDFQPSRPEAIEKAVAAQAEGTLDMELVGSAARGFPALEWLLWTPPAGVSPKAPPAPRSAARTGKAKAAVRAPAKSGKGSGKSSGKASGKAKTLVADPLPQAVSHLLNLAAQASGQKSTAGKANNRPTAKPSSKASAKAPSRKTSSRSGARSSASAAADPLMDVGGRGAAGSASRTAQPAACKFAQALAADLRAEGLALAEGFAKRLETEPDEAQVVERASESVNQWLGGLEQLRMQAIERPLAEADSNSKARGRPPLPRLLSGSSAVDRQARWSALRSLAVFDGAVAPEPDTALVPLETLLRGRGLNPLADRLHASAVAVDQALNEALPNTSSSLQAASQAIAQLRKLVEDEVAPAMDIRIGFSDADGD